MTSVTFNLNWAELSYYDVVKKAFVVPDGVFNILVGSSSADIRATGSFSCLNKVCTCVTGCTCGGDVASSARSGK